jgi:hypothetical protein
MRTFHKAQNVTLKHLARGCLWNSGRLGERPWQQQRGRFGRWNGKVQEQRGSLACCFVTHAPKTFTRGHWQHIATLLHTLWTTISKGGGSFAFQNVCCGACNTSISAQFGSTLCKRRKLHNTNSCTHPCRILTKICKMWLSKAAMLHYLVKT